MLIGELLGLQSEDRVVPSHQLFVSHLTNSLEASLIISQVLFLVTCGRGFSEEFVNFIMKSVSVSAVTAATLLGAVIIVFSKSVKYILFDSTKEMAYIIMFTIPKIDSTSHKLSTFPFCNDSSIKLKLCSFVLTSSVNSSLSSCFFLCCFRL